MNFGNRQVVVYGAGGHAKVILATIEAEGKHKIVGLLDDDESKHDTELYGYRILGGREQLLQLRHQGVAHAIVAVGSNFNRASLARLLVGSGFHLASAIHPTATLLRGCRIGAGTMILVNAFVGADASIGDNAIVSVGVVVGHDSAVGSHAHLCPRVSLAGHVRVGEHAFLGMGVTVLPGVAVGRNVVVGANAVVTKPLPDWVTAVGVPARIIARRERQP